MHLLVWFGHIAHPVDWRSIVSSCPLARASSADPMNKHSLRGLSLASHKSSPGSSLLVLPLLRRVQAALRALPSSSFACVRPALDITARPMSSIRPSESALHVSVDVCVCSGPKRFAPSQWRDRQKYGDVPRCAGGWNRRTRQRTPPRVRLDAWQSPAPSREGAKVGEAWTWMVCIHEHRCGRWWWMLGPSTCY